MLIAVEGPSKAGKSFLIERMTQSNCPPLERIPLWTRPENILKFKEEHKCWDLFVGDELSILSTIDWTKNNLLIDRHPFISEYAYSIINLRETCIPIGDPGIKEHIHHGTFLIFLKPEHHVLMARGKTAKEATSSIRTYNSIIQNLKWKKGEDWIFKVLEIPIHSEKTNLDPIMEKILNNLGHFQRSLEIWNT